jgi:hypothetical protein
MTDEKQDHRRDVYLEAIAASPFSCDATNLMETPMPNGKRLGRGLHPRNCHFDIRQAKAANSRTTDGTNIRAAQPLADNVRLRKLRVNSSNGVLLR